MGSSDDDSEKKENVGEYVCLEGSRYADERGHNVVRRGFLEEDQLEHVYLHQR